jgi:hypothetical protein
MVNATIQLSQPAPTSALDFGVYCGRRRWEHHTMFVDQTEASAAAKPLLDTAWSILEAANEVRDAATVDACRRVIDATFRGAQPAESDMNIVLGFFN